MKPAKTRDIEIPFDDPIVLNDEGYAAIVGAISEGLADGDEPGKLEAVSVTIEVRAVQEESDAKEKEEEETGV